MLQYLTFVCSKLWHLKMKAKTMKKRLSWPHLQTNKRRNYLGNCCYFILLYSSVYFCRSSQEFVNSLYMSFASQETRSTWTRGNGRAERPQETEEEKTKKKQKFFIRRRRKSGQETHQDKTPQKKRFMGFGREEKQEKRKGKEKRKE